MTPTDPQKTHQEFQVRLNAMSDEELIGAFNSDMGKPGWTSSRSTFHTALCDEFKKRHYDYSAVGGTGGISFIKKVKLIGKEVVFDENSQ